MTREKAMADVQVIFRTLFDDENIEICDATTADDIEDWNSLEHINLVNMIERHFNIRLSMKDVVGFKNVGDMIDCILRKLV
jgi:acyl carrier protein